jgi:hypothetical protein
LGGIKLDQLIIGQVEEMDNQNIKENLLKDLEEAEEKAWDSLARYKFQMFGYWAAIWVHLNRIGNFKRPNPWTDLVKLSREKVS